MIHYTPTTSPYNKPKKTTVTLTQQNLVNITLDWVTFQLDKQYFIIVNTYYVPSIVPNALH